jgi:glutaredoxin
MILKRALKKISYGMKIIDIPKHKIIYTYQKLRKRKGSPLNATGQPMIFVQGAGESLLKTGNANY